MIFQKDYIHHLYNQGNNGRKLFFTRDNYLYFQKKIKRYIFPYADILAWCLMPNHFHLMVYVREIALPKNSNEINQSQPLTENNNTLNNSIGIMLRSYTRAINKQEKFTGSLFRKDSKAVCLNCPQSPAPSFFLKQGVPMINVENPERQYPQICFDYIHLNPVKSGLVNNPADWEFSSAGEFSGLRNVKLVNKELAGKYVNLPI